jgi:alpha-L-rhamnosidase
VKRRNFIIQSSILTTGLSFRKLFQFSDEVDSENSLYEIFKNPSQNYRPFVRWWWNGDKVERNELARELRLLQGAGIGGIEINPIKFPARTDDLGKPSLAWLSDQWIDAVQFTLDEARSLGLTCDLIVGSGWPFGAEWLEGEERSQIIVVGARKLEGPLDYETSLFDLLKQADPAISSPFPGRTVEMLSVQLAPAIINNREDVKDLSDQIPNGSIRFKVPQGKFVLYALVKIRDFAQVIQGAPGATGPVLNHYNKAAVRKYLDRMSDTIQQKIGPLSSHIRSLFTDSLELEGANWCMDMQQEFQKRRGYDLVPWLPFILYKIESMGNTWIYDYAAEHGPEFNEMINRMRYDFELTKAELIKERFVDIFIDWCKQNKVRSRMQAYGRGYLLLEGSFSPDIPECETWIKAGLGTEMSETDYRIGRAYTMINKFVSSAAHLKGKRLISCEELTNTDRVFNETLELMKVATDQSIMSGGTHPIFHGFNYSPPDALFPGWVIYGCFINEKNLWWPYFRLFVDYRARLSALLQQATMFADIAILPATVDTWSIYSAQNEPFPAMMYPEWQTLVWESIHQNGNACDYVSEKVIQDSVVKNGFLQYGSRKYHSIFLTQVESIEPATAKKLLDFVGGNGKIFFIETFPAKAPGWTDHASRDKEVNDSMNKIKAYSDCCIFLKKPEKGYTAWFKDVQEKHKINPYVKIDSPGKFITQVRYQAQNVEILVFINSNINESCELTITPSSAIVSGKQAWLWNPESGERWKLPNSGSFTLDMGPADLKLLVFDTQRKGPVYSPAKKPNGDTKRLTGTWSVEGHPIEGSIIKRELDALMDLKENPEWTSFCGTITYRNTVTIKKSEIHMIDLGKVYGVSELSINGINAGVKWWGKRIYSIGEFVKEGDNEIVIKIVTTMGNYMKSLTGNKIAQYWTNEGRKNQPIESMGLLGPVSIY